MHGHCSVDSETVWPVATLTRNDFVDALPTHSGEADEVGYPHGGTSEEHELVSLCADEYAGETSDVAECCLLNHLDEDRPARTMIDYGYSDEGGYGGVDLASWCLPPGVP